MREERLQEAGVSPHDGGMKRRVPGAVGIRVGAFLEEKCPEHPLVAVGREHERRHAGGRRILDVGAGRQQTRGRLDVTRARGEQQRGEAALFGVVAAF